MRKDEGQYLLVFLVRILETKLWRKLVNPKMIYLWIFRIKGTFFWNLGWRHLDDLLGEIFFFKIKIIRKSIICRDNSAMSWQQRKFS